MSSAQSIRTNSKNSRLLTTLAHYSLTHPEMPCFRHINAIKFVISNLIRSILSLPAQCTVAIPSDAIGVLNPVLVRIINLFLTVNIDPVCRYFLLRSISLARNHRPIPKKWYESILFSDRGYVISLFIAHSITIRFFLSIKQLIRIPVS